MFNGLYCICIVVYILNSKTVAQKKTTIILAFPKIFEVIAHFSLLVLDILQ